MFGDELRARGGIGKIFRREVDQSGDLLYFRIVDAIPRVVRGVIVRMLAGIEHHHRHALDGERVVVAAREPAFRIVRVGFVIELQPDLPVLRLDDPADVRVIQGAHHVHLVAVLFRVRVPLRVVFVASDHVRVQHGHRVRERHNRIVDIVEGAEQPVLFRFEDQEHQAALRRSARGAKGLRHRHHRGAGRRVVVGAVIDERSLLADVIVVARDEHVFVFQFRIGSFENAHDVSRLNNRAILDGATHGDRHAGDRHRMRLAGLIDLILESIDGLAAFCEQHVGHLT